MARSRNLVSRNKKKSKYDARMLVFLALSLMLVLFMILAMILPSLGQ